MKQEHKKTFKGRLLAWVLTFAMLCTGMNVTAFAQDMSFDDGTVTEVQTEELKTMRQTEQMRFLQR